MSASDPWRRFAEIWAMVMQDCCLPMICEAQICRMPPDPMFCALHQRWRWEKTVTAYDGGERPRERWPQDNLFQNAEKA